MMACSCLASDLITLSILVFIGRSYWIKYVEVSTIGAPQGPSPVVTDFDRLKRLPCMVLKCQE